MQHEIVVGECPPTLNPPTREILRGTRIQYEGQFVDGKKIGLGIFYGREDGRKNCWHNEIKTIVANWTVDANGYTGFGQGVINYIDDSQFIGVFRNFLPTMGIHTSPNGVRKGMNDIPRLCVETNKEGIKKWTSYSVNEILEPDENIRKDFYDKINLVKDKCNKIYLQYWNTRKQYYSSLLVENTLNTTATKVIQIAVLRDKIASFV